MWMEIFLNRGQEEDFYCRFPRLLPGKERGKAGKYRCWGNRQRSQTWGKIRRHLTALGEKCSSSRHCRLHIDLDGDFFDRGQEEDLYCRFPRLHPRKEHRKVGKYHCWGNRQRSQTWSKIRRHPTPWVKSVLHDTTGHTSIWMEILSTEGKRRIIIVTFFGCIQEKFMRR